MTGHEHHEQESQNFVTSSSLKNYVVATGSLTLVINLSLYIYKVAKGTDMPLLLLIIIALALSIFYILSFFKREEGLSTPQHIWITLMNSLMLFTSISGVNGMLDSARTQFESQNAPPSHTYRLQDHVPIDEASIGSFFKHLIFPTHGWFNTAEATQNATKEIINSAITNIDVTQKLTDTLIRQKITDLDSIDSLHQAVTELGNHYLQAMESFHAAEKILKERNIPYKIDAGPLQVVPKFEPAEQRAVTQKQQINQLQVQQQHLMINREQLVRQIIPN
jgi:hypothetical protein